MARPSNRDAPHRLDPHLDNSRNLAGHRAAAVPPGLNPLRCAHAFVLEFIEPYLPLANVGAMPPTQAKTWGDV